MRRHRQGAQKTVKSAMRRKKKGTLRGERSGKKVTSAEWSKDCCQSSVS